MISFYYNNNYYPPAPVLQIVLRDDDNQESGQYEILIDSGADATIIPRGWLKGLNVVPTGSGNVTSYWGDRRSATLYGVDIRIGTIILPAIEVIADFKITEGILGRDALNQLNLTLNGWAEVVEVDDSL